MIWVWFFLFCFYYFQGVGFFSVCFLGGLLLLFCLWGVGDGRPQLLQNESLTNAWEKRREALSRSSGAVLAAGGCGAELKTFPPPLEGNDPKRHRDPQPSRRQPPSLHCDPESSRRDPQSLLRDPKSHCGVFQHFSAFGWISVSVWGWGGRAPCVGL